MVGGLTYGLREADRSNSHSYDPRLLLNDGAYGTAHTRMSELVSNRYFVGERLGELDRRLRLMLVHECEQARAWYDNQTSGKTDYWQMRVEHDDLRREECAAAVKAINRLIELDRKQPYWIRQAFAAGLVNGVAKDAGFDACWNPKGGFRVKLSAHDREVLEPQFLMQAALGRLDNVLVKARDRLKGNAAALAAPWPQVGNLRVSPSLTRLQRGKLSREGNLFLGVATLGLSVALSSWFRLASSDQFSRVRHTGEAVPIGGRPFWNLVTDFVGLALPTENSVSEESIRKRWSDFSKGRAVSIHNWPQHGIREQQITEKN
jgi:hypothetical protein